MEQKRFEVEITFRQTLRYAVDATNRKAAEQTALNRWRSGDEATVIGSNCCELQDVRAQPVPGNGRCEKDADDVYRYLRDRELVIETLDEDAFNPTVHDAVSAEEVAVHMDWFRHGDGVEGLPDIPRAARALDRLCGERRVVCFNRARVRADVRAGYSLFPIPYSLPSHPYSL